MGKTILFVYGSLKTGQANHRLIADQEYLGPAVTEPRYRIIDMGRYPGLVEDAANGLAVRGELWAVARPCLLELDEFEGGEGTWSRHSVRVEGREGVQAYVWTGPVPDGVRSGEEWPFASPT